MKWLLWREYRLNRLILIMGAVLLLLPYLVIMIAHLWQKAPTAATGEVYRGLVGAAAYSLVLSQLTMVLLGGNAMAGERADRSAQFIGYLPLSRTRRLGSKLILAFFCTALIWGTNLLVLWILVSNVPGLRADFSDLMLVYYVAITGSVFFGVSWLISSFQSSPTFAVGGGLFTPLLVFMGLHAAAWAMDLPPFGGRAGIGFVGIGYATICPILAVVCFSIGTWYYLKRVEP